MPPCTNLLIFSCRILFFTIFGQGKMSGMTEQEQIKEAFEDLLKSLRKDTAKESLQKIREAFDFANGATGVCVAGRASLISCTLWLWQK